jgi:hypothetical protein
MPRHVEETRRDEYEDHPELGMAGEQPKPRDGNTQEQNVVEAVEEHWSPTQRVSARF